MWLGASPWLSSKESPTVQEVQEMWVQSLDWEDPLEEEMATHPSILAGEILWIKEPASYDPQGHKKSGTTEQLSSCRMWLDSNCKQDVECSGSSTNPNSRFLFLFFWWGACFQLGCFEFCLGHSHDSQFINDVSLSTEYKLFLQLFLSCCFSLYFPNDVLASNSDLFELEILQTF